MKKLYLLLLLFTSFSIACSTEEVVPFPDEIEGNDNKDDDDEVVDPKPDAPLHEWTSEDLICTIEAEDGQLNKLSVKTSQDGFSGNGYVTDFWSSEASATWTVEVEERALYRIKIDYVAKGGNSHSIIINGKENETSQLTLPYAENFTTRDMGKYLLEKGKNTITFRGGWGDVYLDKISVFTGIKNSYSIASTPINPKANEAARSLYSYLKNNFGSKIISGHLDGQAIQGITDCRPMLYGWDLYSYTEGYPWKWSNDANNGEGGHVFGSEDNGNIDAAIKWHTSTNGKGIVALHWHWCSPKGGKPGTNTFYTEYTTFDVTKAVEEGTEENKLILRDIEAIASQLKKLQDAGVPVLFRPLHEAGGGWFWWGAKGPEPCKKLWNILYDKLTNQYGLNNLIWVWSTNETEWYPGDDKVDVIGYDSYPGEYNVGVQNYMFNDLYLLTGGHKIIAMTENGPLPNPDACFTQDTPWALFMSWGNMLYDQNLSEHIKNVYHHEKVLTIK